MFVLLDFPTMDPCLEDYIFVISLHESYSGISKTVHGHRTLESPACFFQLLITTGNAAFVVRLNFCRASFIRRTAKSFFAVRHKKCTVMNLCCASYLRRPCVLNTDAWQRFFSSSTFCNKRPLVFDVRRLETHGKDNVSVRRTAKSPLCRAFCYDARQRFF
jgi:hypothetical protein